MLFSERIGNFFDRSGTDAVVSYYDVRDEFIVTCNDKFNVLVIEVDNHTNEIVAIHDDERGRLEASLNIKLEVNRIVPAPSIAVFE